MKHIDEYLYKYCLHDCCMDRICFENGNLCMYFDSGIYELDMFGQESHLTKGCKIEIEIDRLCAEKAWEHIQLYKVKKGKIKEISFVDFEKKLKKSKFDIDIPYFSPFCRGILVHGYLSTAQYVLIVSEITDVRFCFFESEL